GVPPVTGTEKIALRRLFSSTKTIDFESGLQVIHDTGYCEWVICCWPEPSGFIIQRSNVPSRFEKNAMCAPSGDHAGEPFDGVAPAARLVNATGLVAPTFRE